MKKIIMSVLVLAATVTVVAGATRAFFSDTATSTGNTFTAGTLDLTIEGGESVVAIALSNLKPTDFGTAAPYPQTVRNDGSITGNLSVAVSAVTDTEGLNPASETETTGAGELGSKLTIALWMDADQSGIWSTGDYYLQSDGSTVAWVSGAVLPLAAYDVVDNYASENFSNVQNVVGATDFGDFRVEYNFPDGGVTDNEAQGDASAFDLTFSLSQ